jgi:pimeloyl-ACP methyl ester carboxylesterase
MTRETLVMLPGMMCDARLFAPQIVALDSRYDIVVPALCSPNSIEGLARRILEDVTAPRFNLLGLSMGGIVAMVMAGLAPARVARLALLDSNHRADAPERRHIRNRQIAAVREGRLRGVIAEEMKPNYLAVASRGDKALLDTMLAMAVDLGPACFINQSEALRDRRDQSEVLSRYAGPRSAAVRIGGCLVPAFEASRDRGTVCRGPLGHHSGCGPHRHTRAAGRNDPRDRPLARYAGAIRSVKKIS